MRFKSSFLDKEFHYLKIHENAMLVEIFLGLSRPYPLKVSGREISYKYVPDRKYFSLKFVPADDSGTLSEIVRGIKKVTIPSRIKLI